jgi:hypothetical protein
VAALEEDARLARLGYVAPGFDTLARLLKRLRASRPDPEPALQETHA